MGASTAHVNHQPRYRSSLTHRTPPQTYTGHQTSSSTSSSSSTSTSSLSVSNDSRRSGRPIRAEQAAGHVTARNNFETGSGKTTKNGAGGNIKVEPNEGGGGNGSREKTTSGDVTLQRSSTSDFSSDCVASVMTLVSDNTGHQTTNDADYVIADGASLIPERFPPSLSSDDHTLVGLGRAVGFDPTLHHHQHHSATQWFTNGSRGSGQDFLYDRLSIACPDPSGLQNGDPCGGGLEAAVHGAYPGTIGAGTGCGWYGGSGDVPPTPAGTPWIRSSDNIAYSDAARIFSPSTRQSCQLFSSSSSSSSSANFRSPYYPIGNGYAYVTDNGGDDCVAKF